jgi:hypothetical protein
MIPDSFPHPGIIGITSRFLPAPPGITSSDRRKVGPRIGEITRTDELESELGESVGRFVFLSRDVGDVRVARDMLDVHISGVTGIAASETNSTCKLTVLRIEPHVVPAHKRMRIISCYFLTELHDVRFILL